MSKDTVLCLIVLILFLGLVVWGVFNEAPTTIPRIRPVTHNITTHEIVCVTVKQDYCYRYEIRKVIQE